MSENHGTPKSPFNCWKIYCPKTSKNYLPSLSGLLFWAVSLQIDFQMTFPSPSSLWTPSMAKQLGHWRSLRQAWQDQNFPKQKRCRRRAGVVLAWWPSVANFICSLLVERKSADGVFVSNGFLGQNTNTRLLGETLGEVKRLIFRGTASRFPNLSRIKRLSQKGWGHRTHCFGWGALYWADLKRCFVRFRLFWF